MLARAFSLIIMHIYTHIFACTYTSLPATEKFSKIYAFVCMRDIIRTYVYYKHNHVHVYSRVPCHYVIIYRCLGTIRLRIIIYTRICAVGIRAYYHGTYNNINALRLRCMYTVQ